MIVEDITGEERRCIDADGSPLCGAKAEGALLVDHRCDATCPTCVMVSYVPVGRLTAPGTA